MIILDENLKDDRILDGVAQWYQGQVITIRDLRPRTIIKDEAIPSLLRRVDEPTFVTINTDDFWLKTSASRYYCIITLELPKERSLEIPELVREILRMNEFKTKAARMGKVIRWTPTRIEYYDMTRRVTTIPLA